jgi:hypothetical protein
MTKPTNVALNKENKQIVRKPSATFIAMNNERLTEPSGDID